MIARSNSTDRPTCIYCYEGPPLGGQKFRKANRYIWWLAFSDDQLTFNLLSQLYASVIEIGSIIDFKSKKWEDHSGV